MNSLESLITKNLHETVFNALEFGGNAKALIVYDTDTPLCKMLLQGYKNVLVNGVFVDFSSVTEEEIKMLISGLVPGDLVILVQSSNFRLNEFRFRIELFARNLKTIEHVHLGRIAEAQFETYVQALSYDPNYYRSFGHALKTILDTATEIVVECAGTRLVYTGGMELSKLNIGDYSNMKNVGGTFPIGEVFTEAKDLTHVNGEVMIFAYAGEDHCVRIVPPFRVVIEQGILTAPDAPQDFQSILELIRTDEEVCVREFGLGLNPAMGKHSLVNDITAFERQKGMHLSLGAKHAIYAKPGFNRKKGRYHVDIFVDIETISVDKKKIYSDGEFCV